MNTLARLLLSLLLEGLGCSSIPSGRAAVNSVDMEGTDRIDSGALEDEIATKESPKFLGLFRGLVYDYSIYNRQILERDLRRIERYYRARGYYQAKVRAGRVSFPDPKHVEVTIEVEEGPPVLLATVQVLGLDQLAPDVAQAVKEAAIPMRIGAPFDEDVYKEVESAIKRALTDNGYAYAQLTRQARVDTPNGVAGAWYRVKPGPLALFGRITIEGEGPLNEEPIRRALAIKPGDPYSTRELENARSAVLGLGVFSNVDLAPQLDDPPPADCIVPLHVRVTNMKLRTVQLGVGFELDVIRTDLHLAARWEHRNFLGGYRHLAIEFKPGVVLYPTRLPNLPAPEHYLLEEKSRVEFRQPGFIESRTSGVIRGEFNVFPVLLTPEHDPDATVIGYRELKAASGLERGHRKFFGAFFYNYQRNDPFSYVGALDPALSGVSLSFLDLLAQLDLRDNQHHPHKGAFLGIDLQYAGGPLMGDAHDVKVQPEARGYVPLGRKVTLAMRASTGFLFPFSYGDTLLENATRGRRPQGISRKDWIDDVQLMFLRGFFSGGASSNRGYPLRGIGPHGVIPFFNPTIAAEELETGCAPGAPNAGSSRCNQPLGGMTLWEASAELRVPISGPLTGSTFCDASDVSPEQVQIRFNYPHLSCGLGLRYDTPVGPVRLDVGYRIPGMQVVGKDDSEVDGVPGDILGLPIAIALGIGEAF